MPNTIQYNTIQCGDCLYGMKSMEDTSVDLIITDPPYLISYKTNYRKDKTYNFCSEIQNDNNHNFISRCINECYRILKNNSAMYMFCSSKTVDFFRQKCEEAGFTVKNTIIWVKNNWTAGDLRGQFGQQYEVLLLLNKGRKEINGRRLSDVWMFDRVSGKKQIHQNQKPVELIERCILKHSSEGDLIFDPLIISNVNQCCKLVIGGKINERILLEKLLGFKLFKKHRNRSNKN